MAIALRTAHIIVRDLNWSVGVSPLHSQIKINDGVATVASHHQPMMIGR